MLLSVMSKEETKSQELGTWMTKMRKMLPGLGYYTDFNTRNSQNCDLLLQFPTKPHVSVTISVVVGAGVFSFYSQAPPLGHWWAIPIIDGDVTPCFDALGKGMYMTTPPVTLHHYHFCFRHLD